MSHFTVLVAAENDNDLEAKLLPYHEYECTGIEEYTEFVVEIPAESVAQEAQKLVADERIQKQPYFTTYQAYLQAGDHDALLKHYYRCTKNDKGDYGRVTNPNSKWDWWVIGGRWSDLLVVQPVGEPIPPAYSCNFAHSDLIDWDASRRQAKKDPTRALTFAFVDQGGKWHQRAEMGWWASTSDPNDTYNAEFQQFIDSVHGIVYVVDCHI